MDEQRAIESVESLARRMSSVPDELCAAALSPLPDLGEFPRWVVSGIGASEGPSRLLVSQLLQQGIIARFQPVTSFIGPTPPEADVLVIVSQRLSPNGRIPLRHRASYRRTILVTSLDPGSDARCAALAADGVTVLNHGPREEDGLILRVIGPALASRTVLHLAAEVAASRGGPPPAWTSRTGDLVPAMVQAAARARPVETSWIFGPTSILTVGDDAELAPGLRTKLLEALAVAEPPVWDLCGVVHGPLQSFYEASRLFFVLESPHRPAGANLRERLERILDSERHRLHVVEATLPPPLSYFEYAAAFDAIILHALRARPRDLGEWPSKGRDGPIYDIDGA